MAGEAAAEYIEGKLKKSDNLILTEAGEGVGYVVPGRIELTDEDEKITFKFRVRKPMKNVYIVFSLNGTPFKKIYKQAIIPSEMEIVNIPRNLLVSNQGKIVVSTEPKEVK